MNNQLKPRAECCVDSTLTVNALISHLKSLIPTVFHNASARDFSAADSAALIYFLCARQIVGFDPHAGAAGKFRLEGAIWQVSEDFGRYAHYAGLSSVATLTCSLLAERGHQLNFKTSAESDFGLMLYEELAYDHLLVLAPSFSCECPNLPIDRKARL